MYQKSKKIIFSFQRAENEIYEQIAKTLKQTADPVLQGSDSSKRLRTVKKVIDWYYEENVTKADLNQVVAAKSIPDTTVDEVSASEVSRIVLDFNNFKKQAICSIETSVAKSSNFHIVRCESISKIIFCYDILRLHKMLWEGVYLT